MPSSKNILQKRNKNFSHEKKTFTPHISGNIWAHLRFSRIAADMKTCIRIQKFETFSKMYKWNQTRNRSPTQKKKDSPHIKYSHAQERIKLPRFQIEPTLLTPATILGQKTAMTQNGNALNDIRTNDKTSQTHRYTLTLTKILLPDLQKCPSLFPKQILTSTR